jgi:hypothetical protein
MTATAAARREIGVVLERRRVDHPWQEHAWRAVAVLPDVPAAPPGTEIAAGEGWARLYAGAAELELFPLETDSYKHNLEGTPPSVFVVLRRTESEPPLALHGATVCVGQAHAHADTMDNVVEALPMPAEIRDWLADFVARHHVERAWFKRKRDRVDPARRGRVVPGEGGEEDAS